MTHRFRPLETFEGELRRVVEEPAPNTSRRWLRLPIARGARWGLLVPLAALLLAGGTIALAATGVILTGSAVPAGAPVGPSEGIGDTVSSRMLPLRVPDPAGGLPWGMRIVETSRGLVCAQVGRLHDGQLGELGTDGAFGDDGLFHPFPPQVVQTFPGGSTEDGTEIDGGTCTLAPEPAGTRSTAWGSAVAAELWGVDRNAAFAPGRSVAAISQRRDISYGLLGPHALSVTYREGPALRDSTVVPGVGAYLIVQAAVAGSDHEGSGEAPGTQTPGEGPGTDGALTTITYDQRDGSTCENGYDARTGAKVSIARACPAPSAPPPSVQATQASSRVHPEIHLRVRSHRVLAADVAFRAPFAVHTASQSYSLTSRGCGPRAQGVAAAGFNRDVARGTIVHIVLPYPFAASCSRSGLPVEVLFEDSAPNVPHSPGRAPGQLVIATTTIRLPRGDLPAAAPR
ncbi:MAG TPA: hypothetical protein VNV44_13585 [Solirubrobacteraceae bacterium]|jgi:hypothetical protein|nr:hypothetical protein [Solirubrobacteraceae bacterium]